MAEARAYGVALRKRLDTAIRELVLPPLGLELGRWATANARDVADDAGQAATWRPRRSPSSSARSFCSTPSPPATCRWRATPMRAAR